jgi:hypothetical protein
MTATHAAKTLVRLTRLANARGELWRSFLTHTPPLTEGPHTAIFVSSYC